MKITWNLELMEKTNHTRIKVSIKNYPQCETMIKAWILLHGGKEIKRSSQNIYFEVYADLLNNRSKK